MTGKSIAATAALLLLLMVLPAAAQRATERYIPLGRSPGLSMAQTLVGPIIGADAEARTVTLGARTERHSVRITADTKIWIDRTGYGLSNIPGSFDDLKSGRRAEVKYVDEGRRETADWIKVVPEAAN